MGGIMKKIKVWWAVNAFWLLLYIFTALFLYFRRVDAAGVVQNNPIKMVNIAVISVAFLIVIVFQLVILHFIRK